jgi:hypothetical protein
MGVMAVPKPAKTKTIDPLTRTLETIEVPRAWIRDHGWPTRYLELEARLAAQTPGITRSARARGEIVMLAETPLDVAFFRRGNDGQACLYVQAWRGPA